MGGLRSSSVRAVLAVGDIADIFHQRHPVVVPALTKVLYIRRKGDSSLPRAIGLWQRGSMRWLFYGRVPHRTKNLSQSHTSVWHGSHSMSIAHRCCPRLRATKQGSWAHANAQETPCRQRAHLHAYSKHSKSKKYGTALYTYVKPH